MKFKSKRILRTIKYERVLIFISLMISISLFFMIIGTVNNYIVAIILGSIEGFNVFVDFFIVYYGFHWLFQTTKPQFFLKNM